MGLSTAILITDTVLSDRQLESLGLYPTGEPGTAEAVLLTGSDVRACVVRNEAFTVIIDGGEQLMTAAGEDPISLPGAVHYAATVSTVDHSEFHVLSDGRTVRHLRQEEGEITVDEGDRQPGEDSFLLTGDDLIAEAEAEFEIDGDLLIQELPALAGVSSALDIFFELSGDMFAGPERPDAETPQAQAPQAGAARKRGVFGRLFGR